MTKPPAIRSEHRHARAVTVACLVWLMGGALTASAAPPEIPLELQMAEQYRRDIGAMDVTWSAITFAEPNSTFAVRRGATPDGTITERHRTRCAWNGDFASEFLPDERGVISYNEDGSPQLTTSSEGKLIRKNGEVWLYTVGLIPCAYWKDKDIEKWRLAQPCCDARALGLNLNFNRLSLLGTDDVMKIGNHIGGFEDEDMGGGVHKVSVHNEYGATLTWYVNAEKGWNPERIVVTDPDGREWTKMEADVQQWEGGVWFPKSVTTYDNLGGLVERIEVEQAVFNDPQMKELPPESIGIEPGTYVFPQADSLPSGAYIWNGDAVVHDEDWWADVKDGVRKFGPTIQYAREHGTSHVVHHAAARIGDLSEWEQYVLGFIGRYKLNPDQAARAWKIHARCKERAEQHIERSKAKIEEVERKLKAAPEDVALLKKRQALREPIDDIFEKDLKPGLEHLPTRAQRAAGEGTAQAQ